MQANRQQGHLSTDDRVRDLLSHPSFAGFGRLILPWDNRAYDENMPLSSLGSLLPYHSHVRPEIVVGALNPHDRRGELGQAWIFYDFYTEAEKKEQPEKRNTGLFFLRGKPGAPFAIISPGGGFSYVGSIHEGFPYAREISRKGYNAFVLKYRAGQGGAVATQDPGCGDLVYLPQRRETRRGRRRLFSLGQLRKAQGWRPRSARTASQGSAAPTCQSLQPS